MKHLFKSAWPAALLMTAGSIALTACGGGSTLSEPKGLPITRLAGYIWVPIGSAHPAEPASLTVSLGHYLLKFR